MLLCSSGAPTWNYISLCLVLGKQGFLGRNLRVEAALRARLTCWKPNSQPLLRAELGMSRERRVHMFSGNRGELAGVGIKAAYV